MTDEQLAQLAAISPLAWVVTNQMVSEQGVPLEFGDHRFLLDIYDDKSDDITIVKSAQVGGTIWATVASAHEVVFERRNSIYVFPTKGSITNDFVVPKVNPLIEKNKFISQHIVLDNQKVKQLGDNFLFYRGAFDERDAISISADTVWSDEFDRSNTRVVRTYRSRTENSKSPRFRTFSNPSAKGFGVDHLFQLTDQMHWFVTCPHCDHCWYLDWDPAGVVAIDDRCHTIDMERRMFVCGHCSKELPAAARRDGEWVAAYPERSKRGYWINQMMRPDRSAARLIQQYEDDKNIPGYVYNFILGKAYTPADALIDRALLVSANTQLDVPKNEVYIGVDVGVVKHVVVVTPEGVIDLGTYESWDQIEALFVSLNTRCMVIDALPDITKPRELAKKYPGRVFLAEFDYNSSRQKIANFDPTGRRGFVKIQRTDIMDLIVNELRSRRLQLHLPGEKLERLIAHSIVMVRVEERDVDGKGKLKVFWVTQGDAPDHFWFALVYARVAMLRGRVEAGVVPKPVAPNGQKGVYYNQQSLTFDGLLPDIKKRLRKLGKKQIRL
jgi:hypothetical protein